MNTFYKWEMRYIITRSLRCQLKLIRKVKIRSWKVWMWRHYDSWRQSCHHACHHKWVGICFFSWWNLLPPNSQGITENEMKCYFCLWNRDVCFCCPYNLENMVLTVFSLTGHSRGWRDTRKNWKTNKKQTMINLFLHINVTVGITGRPLARLILPTVWKWIRFRNFDPEYWLLPVLYNSKFLTL